MRGNVLNNNRIMHQLHSTIAANSYSLIFYALLDIFIVMDPEPDITTMEF